jgi:hypothetical protein
MARSCRYGYLDGSCANRHIESLECRGVEDCEFSETNILTKASGNECGRGCNANAWLGLYCEKYRRFFCSGEEHCMTHESYLHRLALHHERRLREEP